MLKAAAPKGTRADQRGNMHFSDGDRCTYFGTFKGNLVAIGWLEAKYPISTEGNVGIEFIKTIATLLQDA